MFDYAVPMHRVMTFRGRFALCGMAALALIVGVIIAMTFSAAAQHRNADGWYAHTFEVLLVAERLETALNLSLRGERGYLITGNRESLEPYLQGRSDTRHWMRKARVLVRDNVVQHRNLDLVEQRLEAYLAETARAVKFQAGGRHRDAVAIVKSGSDRRHIESALDAIEQFREEEYRLLEIRNRIQLRYEARDQELMYVLAGIGALLVALLTAAIVSGVRAHQRALELAHELQVQATTDALTGLPNRRYVMEALETEVHRASRTGRPLALAMLDLDRFKLINDTHGHPSGDAVLRSVADVLRRACRGGDLIGRLGGEEFAMLMPETTREEAEIACERIRKAIAKRTIAYPSGAFGRITVSTGIAVWSVEEPSRQFIARADEALYQAKQDGRNVVRLAA